MADEGAFVRLTQLPAPKVVASAEDFPGGGYKPGNLLDGKIDTEYASAGKGADTFVEFDFGQPVAIGLFRHVNRKDPALVAASELTFFDAAGGRLSTVSVRHVGEPGGTTMFVLPKAVTAQRTCPLAGRETGQPGHHLRRRLQIAFYPTGNADRRRRHRYSAQPAVVIDRQGDGLVQPLGIVLDYPYMAPIDAVVRVEGEEPKFEQEFASVHLTFGANIVTATLPAVEKPQVVKVAVEHAGQTLTSATLAVQPARKFTVYLLPHSHIDIGYTQVQPEVKQKQSRNIEKALDICDKSADYPPGARFKWNAEVLWAVESYIREGPGGETARVIDAIHKGQLELDSLYGNELTGLCRPEELLRLLQWGITLGEQYGVKVESAMISDVPGLTWGMVRAVHQAGVKYLSLGINFGDNGRIFAAWEDKPFYWLPRRRQKILCWIPYKGYALGHPGVGFKLDRDLPGRLAQLQRQGFPYDIVQLRWNVGGDNGAPDASLPDLVKAWNAKHAYPRMVIAATTEAFREFERRYAAKIPVVSGDFTPYWENGACSSAAETAVNRTAAERLVQAEAIDAMFAPQKYPAGPFSEAWRNVILYDEHTWARGTASASPTFRS